jgi:2-polyprenyl-3-methyl-5-hydroxy-6-metoxy-1,4-benzoquinol methylase
VAYSQELRFQADRAAQIEVEATPDYIIDRYRRCRYWRLFPKDYLFKALWRHGVFSGGKRVLDFGCGEGKVATELAKLGCRVTGIDISPELIDLARRRAALDGVSDSVELRTADLSGAGMAGESFDVVLCNEVLHHVSIPAVFPRLMAVLKPDGMAAIAEPIAFSPALQRVRDRVPVEKDASPDERQLNREDIAYLRSWFAESDAAYFNLFARVDRLFPNANKIDQGHVATKSTLIGIRSLDRALVTACPPLRKFYGQIVVIGRRLRDHAVNLVVFAAIMLPQLADIVDLVSDM